MVLIPFCIITQALISCLDAHTPMLSKSLASRCPAPWFFTICSSLRKTWPAKSFCFLSRHHSFDCLPNLDAYLFIYSRFCMWGIHIKTSLITGFLLNSIPTSKSLLHKKLLSFSCLPLIHYYYVTTTTSPLLFFLIFFYIPSLLAWMIKHFQKLPSNFGRNFLQASHLLMSLSSF